VSDTRRLLVAALVLVTGLVVAFVIPSGSCPSGGRLDPAPGSDGGYWCHVSDVGYSASSLIPLKIGIAIGAVVGVAILVVPVLSRRRRRTTVGVG
jgi:hypothetical protein